MERVLVTGAGGYIGTTLVPLLLDHGYAVRALDRFFFGGHLLGDHPRLERIRADSRRLEPAHVEGVDHVIDLAAISNDPSGARFREATCQINHHARVRCAGLARAAGVRRYLLPSSCSVYGFHEPRAIRDETSPTRPLTTYARANELAERGVLALARPGFCVVVLRQATVYGYSPRMRFDLAVNGMTYGAWKTGQLPLMRDGTQWRPMIHVRDAARAQIMMLQAPEERVTGEVFNIGSAADTHQLGPLADLIRRVLPKDVRIDWYGDPDQRSYRVAFDKVEALGWRAEFTADEGAREIFAKLEAGELDRTRDTITLQWYQDLTHWHRRLREVELHGGILEIEP